MEEKEFLNNFNVSEDESKLKILSCSKQPLTKSHLIWVDKNKLPHLDFKDQSFNLALCEDLLFTEPKQNDQFYLDSLLELARVAGEVRVYPLLDKQGLPSIHLGPVLQALQEKGIGVELKEIKTSKEGKAALLRIWNPSCVL